MTSLDKIVDLLATNECEAECDMCPFWAGRGCVLEAEMQFEIRFLTLKRILIKAVLEWEKRNGIGKGDKKC